MKSVDQTVILVPVSNWHCSEAARRRITVLWLPIDQIVAAIVQLIQIRKQTIDDVYQITGLSDIMRGSTVASETLGAQQLQVSVRFRSCSRSAGRAGPHRPRYQPASPPKIIGGKLQ